MLEAIWLILCFISRSLGSREGEEFLGAVLYRGLFCMREEDIFI
jgi:hypothetical protein